MFHISGFGRINRGENCSVSVTSGSHHDWREVRTSATVPTESSSTERLKRKTSLYRPQCLIDK